MSNSQTPKKLENLSWIVDNWVYSEGESISFERWKKTDDSHFEGWSETIKNGDTIFSEKLKILMEDGQIYYVADVKHNPSPVYFKLTEVSEGKAVFENPEHDFPQKITYELEQGTLRAYIEGPGKSGAWEKVIFSFKKMR